MDSNLKGSCAQFLGAFAWYSTSVGILKKGFDERNCEKAVPDGFEGVETFYPWRKTRQKKQKREEKKKLLPPLSEDIILGKAINRDVVSVMLTFEQTQDRRAQECHVVAG